MLRFWHRYSLKNDQFARDVQHIDRRREGDSQCRRTACQAVTMRSQAIRNPHYRTLSHVQPLWMNRF